MDTNSESAASFGVLVVTVVTIVQAGHVLGPEPDESGGVEVVGDHDHGWPVQAHSNSLLAVLAGSPRGSGRSSTSDESAPMPSAITRSVTSAM